MESVLVVPDLVSNSSFPDADIILASDHRGYLLNFTTGDSTAEFNAMSECRTYSSRLWGFQIGAIRLCVGNTSPNELEARLLTCPISIAIQQMCLNDTSWNYNVDWTAKMSVFFQNSAVAYSRSNGTILWHSFAATPAIPVNISSSQILEAYDNWLFDTTTLLHKNGTALPLFSSSTVAFWLWATEPEFNGQNAVNPAESNGIFAILQSLLVMPLYYCQNGMMMRLIQGNFKSFSNPDLAGLHSLLSATPERSSPASFANYRYESIVSYPSIIAYIILSGIAVLACSVALVVIKVYADRTSQGRGMPRLSRFPALDLFAHCTVEDENRCVIYQGRSGIFPTDTSQRSLRSWHSLR